MKIADLEREDRLRIMCDNIKFIRKKTKITQGEMAKRLDVSIRSIFMLEKGIVPPRLSCEIVFKLHSEFGISPNDIFKKRLH